MKKVQNQFSIFNVFFNVIFIIVYLSATQKKNTDIRKRKTSKPLTNFVIIQQDIVQTKYNKAILPNPETVYICIIITTNSN